MHNRFYQKKSHQAASRSQHLISVASQFYHLPNSKEWIQSHAPLTLAHLSILRILSMKKNTRNTRYTVHRFWRQNSQWVEWKTSKQHKYNFSRWSFLTSFSKHICHTFTKAMIFSTAGLTMFATKTLKYSNQLKKLLDKKSWRKLLPNTK